MEACFQNAEWDTVEVYARALQEFTCAEPLPWSDFFIARALALKAAHLNYHVALKETKRLRDEAKRIGLNNALPALDAALSENLAARSCADELPLNEVERIII